MPRSETTPVSCEHDCCALGGFDGQHSAECPTRGPGWDGVERRNPRPNYDGRRNALTGRGYWGRRNTEGRDRRQAASAPEPTTTDRVLELRTVLGLPSDALPLSPQAAWEEALA